MLGHMVGNWLLPLIPLALRLNVTLPPRLRLTVAAVPVSLSCEADGFSTCYPVGAGGGSTQVAVFSPQFALCGNFNAMLHHGPT